MRPSWIAILFFCTVPSLLRAEPALDAFFSQRCIACHGPDKQKGKVRLDLSTEELFANGELS